MSRSWAQQVGLTAAVGPANCEALSARRLELANEPPFGITQIIGFISGRLAQLYPSRWLAQRAYSTGDKPSEVPAGGDRHAPLVQQQQRVLISCPPWV